MFINKAEVILLNIKMNYHIEEYNGRKEYYSRGKTVNAVVRFKEHEIVAEYNVPAGIDNPVEIREYIASIYDRGLVGNDEVHTHEFNIPVYYHNAPHHYGHGTGYSVTSSGKNPLSK